jgi:hypothetical protein
MQALMTAIVTWLSVNFGLPADYGHPLVKFVPPAEIASLRNAAPQTGRPAAHHLLAPGSADEVLAVYDDRASAILLQVEAGAARPSPVPRNANASPMPPRTNGWGSSAKASKPNSGSTR